MSKPEPIELLAAAVFEIRVLLAPYVGRETVANSDVQMAANLAYALHDDALKVIEEKVEFDVEAAQLRVRGWEEIQSDEYADEFGLLTGRSPKM